MLIDTHTHLDDSRYKDLAEVIKRANESGVKRFVIPGADIKTLKRAVEIAQKNEEVYFAVGVHPYDIDDFDLEYLKKFITHKKCVGVGECGLDYYRESSNSTKQKQKEVFIKQIELSIEFDKPLIVHIREASQDSYDILKKFKNARGVLHCYNVSELLLDLSDNFYYGIGGVLTFKNAKKLVDVVKKIPLNRIVLETDSPYLTPHPHRGKRNEPSYITLVAQKLSQILDIDYQEIQKITTQNSINLMFKNVKN